MRIGRFRGDHRLVRYAAVTTTAGTALMRHFLALAYAPAGLSGGMAMRSAAAALIARAGAAATTPACGSERTHRHSKCCHDRSGCKSVLAPHNAGSCRADNSAPRAPAMPLPKHWTVLGQGRHKGPAQAPFPGTAHRGLGGSDANLETPGLRFFDLSLASISQTLQNARTRAPVNRTLFCRRWRQTALLRYQERKSVLRTDTR